MYSIENNLNNPTRIDTIRIENELQLKKDRVTRYVNQSYYDQIAIPDPFTCYIITDANDGRFYIGETLILPGKDNVKYLMSINSENNDYWDLYLNANNGLFKIATYDNIKTATRELQELITKGNYGSTRCRIYNNIKNYIQQQISIEDCIIGIIINLGIRNNDIELQDIMKLLYNYRLIHDDKYHINRKLCITLDHISDKYPKSIYSLFNKILNVFIYNKYFKEYDGIDDYNNPYNIGDSIDSIMKIYTIWHTL